MSFWGEVAHGMWDLSSLTRNGTHTSCCGSSESQPLDCQGTPCIQVFKVKVAQLCLTLCNSSDYSPAGSSVHGILQARILEWVAAPFSRGLPNPGIKPRSPALQMDSLLSEPPAKPYVSHVHWVSYLTILFSATPFTFCLQSFPASGWDTYFHFSSVGSCGGNFGSCG